MSWKRHFRVVRGAQYTPPPPQDRYGPTTGANFASFLPLVYAGHPNRIQRYYQFDDMDKDSDINAALDTIADFCTQSEEQNDEPFVLHYNGEPNDSEVKILKTMMAKWVKLNNFRSRLWYMFRDTLKNGDAFYLRDPETQEWLWLDHFMVEMVKVDDTLGKRPDEYVIRGLDYNRQVKFATKKADPNQYRTPYGTSNVGASRAVATSSASGPAAFSLAGAAVDPRSRAMMGPFSQDVSVIDAQHVVHMSLTIGNDINWPFGSSILEPIFKTFKQKELLEDAIIIYRVQRAPERRIFYVDVGTMPPEKAKRHIEAIKNEIHQRRIPNRTGTGGCFDMSTEVPLLDGRTLTIAELTEEYQSGTQNWVYSCNPETGEVVPGKITWAGVTRQDAQVLKLTLDNGETITCTPDHKFPIMGKGKIEAKDIEVGKDSLISFNTRLRSIRNRDDNKHPKYHQVYDHASKDWRFTHRLVAGFMRSLNEHNELGLNIEKPIIHHGDFNKYNNNPENLFYMHPREHFDLHAGMTPLMIESKSAEELENWRRKISEGGRSKWQDAEYRERVLAGMTAAMTSDKYRNKMSDIVAARWDSPEYRQKMSQAMLERWEDVRQNHPEYMTEVRNRFIRTTAEQQKKPWCNQANAWDQELFDTVVRTLKENKGGKRETAAQLSKDGDFMNRYRELNAFPGKGINHLSYDKFSVSSLEKLVKAFGFSGWKELLKECGLEIRKPTLGIQSNHAIISHIAKIASTLPSAKMPEVCEALSNDIDFMNAFRNLNNETRGNTNKNKISSNTLKVIVSKHGYESWTAFRENLSLFNHKVVSIEWLSSPLDVGTITVDGKEDYHGFHTFALSQGVFTYNSILDAAYNPLSINDDYFFAQGVDGRGSKVETLPGGEQTGEITDLMFFSRKMARGLRVPTTYLNLGEDDGQNVTFNDGKLGAAMIQEFRFSKFCLRLQSLLAPMFDREFKRYLMKNGIEMEWSLFELQFHPPQSFTRYRQIELDSQRVQVYSGVAENKRLAERFKLQRYLGLSEDEIVENEKLWSEENADKLKKKTGASPAETEAGGLGAVGVHPDAGALPPDLEMPDEGMDQQGADMAGGPGMGGAGAGGAAPPPAAGGGMGGGAMSAGGSI